MPILTAASSSLHADRAVARRILVVDHDGDAAASLALFPESLGHETCVALDAEQALNMAILFRPDMVLLDIGMPRVDGYEVARRLRSLPERTPLHIVAVTIHAGGRTVEASIADGTYAAWWPGTAFDPTTLDAPSGPGGPEPAITYDVTLRDGTVLQDVTSVHS